ncbi:MAG: phosphatase PAP2 family protein [Myxococcales bacterium]|nr:phosphatase PAP2 family protein [Myxococcales bacterium]
MIGGRSPFDIAKRVAGWLASGVVVLGCYGLGKLAGPGHVLPVSAIDAAVPLWPWTIWIYGSGTKAALLAWLLVPDGAAARRLFGTLALCSLACGLAFVVDPTTYPREAWPLPAGDSLTLREFADLRAADSPSNCLPSLHVALAWGLALNWSGWLMRARALPLVWAGAVTLATLTTKQHYLIDLPAGAAVGAAAFWASGRIQARKAAPARLSMVDTRAVDALLTRVVAHQWRLEDLPSPPARPLPPTMVRLLNEVIYIEEIARLNFELLRDASDTPALAQLYGLFAAEERRHADGLRRILAAADAPLLAPGLGNALVLDQFDTLDPNVDAPLVAMSTPVFETFLDAGTIPFLQGHPALRNPAFDAFVVRVCADEAAHLALNWLVSRELARQRGGRAGLGLLLNPNLLRGARAIPWMSLEVYSIAHQLGYDFATLLPPFGRIWRMHERFPELARYPLWWPFRIFAAVGAIATVGCMTLLRVHLLFIDAWVLVTRLTSWSAKLAFGPELLRRRGLPPV